jgi:hypothetical protein
MDFNIIWNDLCFGINEERIKKREDFVQIFIEGIFGRLGWSLSEKEILSREKIQEGKMPDIIIAKNEKHKYFVVELKKPAVSLDNHINQLLGYMRLLRLSIGIFIGDSLWIYYKLPGDNDKFCKIINFPLEENYPEGIELLSQIYKNNFSFDVLKKYCEDRIKNENIILEGKSNEHEIETIPSRLEKIWAYLRDENKKRERDTI